MAGQNQLQDQLIDTDELRAFDAVATKHSFSQAAAMLECSQSTISQRIARLEKRLSRQLLRRTTRSVNLTPDGEAMLMYARSILGVAEEARQHLARPAMQGVLRVGIEDEFATTRLPQILELFRYQFPNFGMRFITGRNEHLRDNLRAQQVDIARCKGPPGGGEALWQEDLVWVGHAAALVAPDDPVPLITYLKPSITRDIAERALLASGRQWTPMVEGSNLLGLLAAAEADLGVMAIGRSFSSPGLPEIPEGAGLPALGALDYILEGHLPNPDPAVNAFSAVLKEAVKQTTREKRSRMSPAATR